MSKTFGDTVNYNLSGINSMIGKVSQLRTEIEKIKNGYDEYIVSNLAPNWRTSGGEAMIKKLQDFSNNDLQNFIKYLENKIEDLQDSNGYVNHIDIS